MSMKFIGAIIIVSACGSVGFSMAMAHRQEEKALQQLLNGLEIMSCELQQRLQPLPQLCAIAARECTGNLRLVFKTLAEELERQIAPDAAICMEVALKAVPKLPSLTRSVLEQLGHSLGRFDMEGQLKGLETAMLYCRNGLDRLSLNRESRLRGYQTLGLCAGAALAILLL